MSKKCVAFSKSKLGLETSDNRKSFYAGWDAALAEQAEQEPVAWMWKPSKPFPQYTVITDNKEYLKAAKEQGVEITPLYAALVAETTGIEQQREIIRLKAIIEEQANGAQNLVLAEREACAKVCETTLSNIVYTAQTAGIVGSVISQLAAAIRARGEK